MEADFTFEDYIAHQVRSSESLDSLAKRQGITWQQLSQFNWGTSKPNDINQCLHEFVGCRRRTANGRNYMFSSHDEPGTLFIPVKSPHYTLATGNTYHIRAIRPHQLSSIEIETVDDFLDVVGGVKLVLTRQEGGPTVEVATDVNGYAIAEGILSGHYRVTLEDGSPTYFQFGVLKNQSDDPNEELGQFREATIDTRQKVEALTQIVVSRRATQVQKQQRRLLDNVYKRRSDRDDKEGRTGRGIETKASQNYSRLKRVVAVDNLALAAGWSDQSTDIARLVRTILPSFFKGRDGAPDERRYYVWVLEPTSKLLRLYLSSGICISTFKVTRTVHGYFGAYSLFENDGGRTFVDMMTKSYPLSVEGREHELIPLQDLVAPADSQRLVTLQNSLESQVPILYLMPTAGQLVWLGIHGGSGQLENYGNEETVNELIHERNLAVCRSISMAYNAYVETYVARVKKATTERDLRFLGPPWSPFIMPIPQGASFKQMGDIYGAYDLNMLRPWRAIATQLDKFANRLSEGYPFISIKAKYDIGIHPQGLHQAWIPATGFLTSTGEPLPTSIEVEGSLTLQLSDEEVRALAEHEEKSKASLEGSIKKEKLGLEFKRSLKKPEEWEVTIKTGPLELEGNKDGTRKISIEALPEVWAESQFNPRKAKFEGGLKIETEAIVKILEELPIKNKSLQHFVENYGERIVPKEISVHAGLMGLREETVLAILSNAPGFFERRSTEELVELQWNELSADEQIHLTELGWVQSSWDLKAYQGARVPETLNQEWDELTPQQQIAVIHLGFYDLEQYQEELKETVNKKRGWDKAVKALQKHQDDESSEEE